MCEVLGRSAPGKGLSKISHLAGFFAGIVLLAEPVQAQLVTNASIKGAYNFRYLGVIASPTDAALSYAGTLTFDGKADSYGNGTFTVTGQGAGAIVGKAANGTYTVWPNGLMQMTDPFDPTGQTILYCEVGDGAILATGATYLDILIAVPAGKNTSTATLNGKYWLASMEFLGGNLSQPRDTFFSATADGNGSFGSSVAISGYAANLGSFAQTQTSSGPTYSISPDGAGTLTFAAASGVAANDQLLCGDKVLYVSPDGAFFIAGGLSSYDIIVGVKALVSSPAGAANGIYFFGYLKNAMDAHDFTVTSAAGSANHISSLGAEIGDLIIWPGQSDARRVPIVYDYTYNAEFAPAADGTVTHSDSKYVVGAGGNIIVGAGLASNYQLTFYVKAPFVVGTGVFLNPQGIVNAASNAPFTASITPGEFLSLYGTGMADQTVTSFVMPFPTTLGGVQVAISWYEQGIRQTVQAPVYYVSPTLISVVVPYSIPTGGYPLIFQVTSNRGPSNIAILYSGPSSPGVFTVPPGGIGNGAILHADFSLVSTASPANAGETVQLFLTGMGAVTPAVAAGSAAPTSPLCLATMPLVSIDGVRAKVAYSGLAPGLAGLYQLNVTIPQGVTASKVTIEIDTYDSNSNLMSVNAMATIPISAHR